MTTPVEDPVETTPAASQTSRKMLQLLRKRLRQLLWVTLGLAIFLVVAGGIFAIWWLTSLNGLPDIGDPFDVAALRVFKIPDDQNAFTYFRRAAARLTPRPELPRVARARNPTVAWSEADPKLRAWVEANRAALELFQQGANLSDGISHPAGELYSQDHAFLNPNDLMRLALLEGDRRKEGGDTAGAWDCYRAVLRATTHFRRRGDLMERDVANTLHDTMRQHVMTWAADPKTTSPQLRRALDEAIESRPKPEWSAFSLKLEYLGFLRFLEQPQDPIHQALDADLTYRIGSLQVPTDLAVYLFAGQRFLKREPERSRRVVKLIFANWLAHVEVPELRQSRPAVRARFSLGKATSSLLLYPNSPKAPAVARALSPQEVATWLVTTNDAKQFLASWFQVSVPAQERRDYRELVVLLAEELYQRERGQPAPSEEALVGPYLQSLPDDGSAELDDGNTPTVSDSRTSDETPPR